jgi:hypothetical protein
MYSVCNVKCTNGVRKNTALSQAESMQSRLIRIRCENRGLFLADIIKLSLTLCVDQMETRGYFASMLRIWYSLRAMELCYGSIFKAIHTFFVVFFWLFWCEQSLAEGATAVSHRKVRPKIEPGTFTLRHAQALITTVLRHHKRIHLGIYRAQYLNIISIFCRCRNASPLPSPRHLPI